MAPDTETIRSDAERCVKRGELREALALYQQIVALSPGDANAARRVKTLEELVAAEGSSPALARPRREAPAPAQSAEQRAELMVERGDHAGALRTYAEILRLRPDHKLAQERHNQISALLAESGDAARKATAPKEPMTREAALLQLRDRVASRRRAAR